MTPTLCARTQNNVYASRQYKKLSEAVEEFFFNLYFGVVVAMWLRNSLAFVFVCVSCEVLNVLRSMWEYDCMYMVVTHISNFSMCISFMLCYHHTVWLLFFFVCFLFFHFIFHWIPSCWRVFVHTRALYVIITKSFKSYISIEPVFLQFPFNSIEFI